MAIIRAREARELDENALLARLAQVEDELLRERGQVSSGGRSSNPGRIRELRRSRARMITILHEKALGIKRIKGKENTKAEKEGKREAKTEEKGKKEEG